MRAPAFTSIGCYPIIYIGSQGHILCADCVSKDEQEDEAWTPDVHWEGDPYQCDECGAMLESAYGPVEES